MKRYIVCVNSSYSNDMLMKDVRANNEKEAVIIASGDNIESLDLNNKTLEDILEYYSDGDILISKPYEIKEPQIILCQEEQDNGDLTCENCIWLESGDESVGLSDGCTHPILFDKNGDIIDDMESLITDCLFNPKHCILLEKKNKN